MPRTILDKYRKNYDPVDRVVEMILGTAVRKGITDKQMSEFAHMSPSGYCRVKKNLSKLSFRQIVDICKGLDIPVDRITNLF